MPSAGWSIPALGDEVSGVRWAAVEFAREHGVPEQRLEDLRLAISEAVSNAVVHAFRASEWPGTVTVRVAVAADCVDVVVRDDGDGMSARDDSPGVGLGLPLISRLADETRFGEPAAGGGFELWMRFRFAAS